MDPTQTTQAGSDTTTPAPSATGAAATAERATLAIERIAERGGDWLWARLRRRPYLGVAVVGGLGFAVASTMGVGEIAFAVLAGYAAYQVLVKKEPPSQALKKAEEVEKELIV